MHEPWHEENEEHKVQNPEPNPTDHLLQIPHSQEHCLLQQLKISAGCSSLREVKKTHKTHVEFSGQISVCVGINGAGN